MPGQERDRARLSRRHEDLRPSTRRWTVSASISGRARSIASWVRTGPASPPSPRSSPVPSPRTPARSHCSARAPRRSRPRQSMALGISMVYQDAELIEIPHRGRQHLPRRRDGGRLPPGHRHPRAETGAREHSSTSLHLNLDEDAAGGGPLLRPEADAPDRQGAVPRGQHPHHGRAHQLPRAGGNSAPSWSLIRELKAQGHRHHLHLPLSRGDLRDRRHHPDPEGRGEHGDLPLARDRRRPRSSARWWDATRPCSTRRSRCSLGPSRSRCAHLGRRGASCEDVSFEVRRGRDFRHRRARGLGPQRAGQPHLRHGPQGRRGDPASTGGRCQSARPARRRARRHLPHHRGPQEARHARAAQRRGERHHRPQRAAPSRPSSNLGAERRLVAAMVERLQIAVDGRRDADDRELSGGNQQKAIIGRWLLSDATSTSSTSPPRASTWGPRRRSSASWWSSRRPARASSWSPRTCPSSSP